LNDAAAGSSKNAPRLESISIAQLLDRLSQATVFRCAEEPGLLSLDHLDLLHMQQGDEIVQDGSQRQFYVVLEGTIKLFTPNMVAPLIFRKGESFGEIPILANKRLRVVGKAAEPSRLVRFSEEQFWKLMFACPSVREEVLGNMARRLEAYQLHEVRREKMSALGALAAGLMHELKNPSTAAIRSASQMRENLMRLQQLTLKLSQLEHNDAQKQCLLQLQQRALAAACYKAMSSIEQADAEEEMEQLLQKAGVENGWKVASTLVSVGMSSQELKCMHEVFSGEELSDSLNWLESLVSSVQLVGTVEESLGRVKDLIMAVKHYSYDDESTERTVDVHDSIQSTLLILGHKLRQKSLTVERDFAKNVPPVHLRGGGLSQVWTNLLDNAIDASPEGGVLRVTTWNDEASVYAAIEDHGTGIAPADAPHVFEPFYTTKPVGEGTGLGLDIVHRILGMKLGGTVRFDSVPGKTVFTVSLPVAAKKEEPQPA
jgi:signal transduction histidine kinase